MPKQAPWGWFVLYKAGKAIQNDSRHQHYQHQHHKVFMKNSGVETFNRCSSWMTLHLSLSIHSRQYCRFGRRPLIRTLDLWVYNSETYLIILEAGWEKGWSVNGLVCVCVGGGEQWFISESINRMSLPKQQQQQQKTTTQKQQQQQQTTTTTTTTTTNKQTGGGGEISSQRSKHNLFLFT